MLPKGIDAVDRRILDLLQQDAQLSNVRLAELVHLSPSPTLARVKRLEQDGVISRYVALADPLKLGLTVSVFVQVSVERQVTEVLERFEHAVAQCPEVMEVYLMTGDSDYLLRITVPDMQSYEQFVLNTLTRIPGVAQIRSSFALKQVKYQTALPTAHLT